MMKRLAKPIYVEIFIRGTLEDLWRLTQTPELHTRWDLRFSRIEFCRGWHWRSHNAFVIPPDLASA